MTPLRRHQGMTLIELMIAVLIVGILAAIAVPSYRNYVIRSQRTDATAALLRLAAAQEKFYLQKNTYASDAELADPPPDGLGFGGTDNGWYDIEIDSEDLTREFTITATPTADGPQATDDHCASFSVTHTGERSATNDDCWG